MASRGNTAHGAPGFPGWYNFVLRAIVLLSATVLALAAYAQSLLGNYFYQSSVPGFLIFVSTWTLLVYGSAIVTSRFASRPLYRILVFLGHVLSAIVWLTGWAWAASWASYTLSFDNYGSYDSVRGSWVRFGQIVAACASIGAVTWVLIVVALVVFIWTSVRHPPARAGSNIELGDVSKQGESVNPTISSSADGDANQPGFVGGPSSAP
ncbi:hypothetical protein F5Y17DRAFT_459412 [Xylariaceae sp. FL0594]|nr:hypothetical protein F5Y17DRAFT_459412 [Xylariaceae sp. FL0594]